MPSTSNESKKPAPPRVFCEHCRQHVAKSTFRTHRRKYYTEETGVWISAADAKKALHRPRLEPYGNVHQGPTRSDVSPEESSAEHDELIQEAAFLRVYDMLHACLREIGHLNIHGKLSVVHRKKLAAKIEGWMQFSQLKCPSPAASHQDLREHQHTLAIHSDIPVPTMKRQAENQEPEQQIAKKRRTAFGDITNQTKNVPDDNKKKGGKKQQKKGTRKSTRTIVVPKTTSNSQPEKDVSWEMIELSQESNNSLSSSQSSQKSNLSQSSNISDVDSLNLKNLQLSQSPQRPRQDWVDVDQENMHDPTQVAVYAEHIFTYYKERELKFLVPDYMPTQQDLTPNMRAILVDWLVEVQENFELNHETLYLAVKMVDHFLVHHQVQRERLQLVGATTLFIACKFDERCPPVIDDFLYICDDAYQREELIRMEETILRTLGFDIGFPLSYRFLRRYAKCCKASMETLTLARFILEMSLMDYNFVRRRDSEMGAACLLLALRMKLGSPEWDATLVHYSGYTEEELLPLSNQLNTMIARKPHRHLTTITSKYSHKVFYEVAKIKPLKVESEGDELIIGD